MSQASKPVARVGRVAFELERFELADGDRWELEGRWFGVRGRRFMRPALTVVVDGQAARLLSDLADKPWAAEDGEPWKAAFPFSLKGELLAAELTVAPDITVTLPLPAARTGARKAKLSAAGRARSGSAGSRKDRAPGGELASLARELADAEAEQRRLQHRHDRAEAEKAQAEAERAQAEAEKAQAEAEKAQAAARMDELLGQLSEVARERDESRTARDQLAFELDALGRERVQFEADREAARRARDEALQASEAATLARDRALADRGTAIAAQRRAESERDAAVAARDQAATERDGALALRDHALAERDAAVAARDDAVYQRDALSRTSERLQSELANVISTRGAALVMRRAAQESPASRRRPALIPSAIGIIAVLTLIVVLLIVLRGM